MPRELNRDDIEALAEDFRRLGVAAFGIRFEHFVERPSHYRSLALNRLARFKDGAMGLPAPGPHLSQVHIN